MNTDESAKEREITEEISLKTRPRTGEIVSVWLPTVLTNGFLRFPASLLSRLKDLTGTLRHISFELIAIISSPRMSHERRFSGVQKGRS